jgi:hypothetical protein
MGVLNLLDPERQVRAIDSDVEQIRHRAVQFSHDIKAVLNLTISEKMTPIEVVQALLGKLGLKLTCVGRDVAADGRRGGARVYQYQPPEDGRVAIFAQWQQRDSLARSSQEGLMLSVPVTVTIPDPPPDISITNQSLDGAEGDERLLEETPQKIAERGGRSFTPDEVNGRGDGDPICEGSSIESGSLVKRLRQTCCWVVKRLEGVTALLRHPQTKEECMVPLDELILVSEAGFS